jgi:hypothetical protein
MREKLSSGMIAAFGFAIRTHPASGISDNRQAVFKIEVSGN